MKGLKTFIDFIILSMIVNSIDGALFANDLPKRFFFLNFPLSFFSMEVDRLTGKKNLSSIAI